MSIPITFIDCHTKICKECEERLSFIKRLYKIEMNPTIHYEENVARDQMFDEMIKACEQCYRATVAKMMNHEDHEKDKQTREK